MDRRSRPGYDTYETEFDACDPVGSVLQWSGRVEPGAARVLRRRCRSEGVERSPYEDAHRETRYDTDVACCRSQRVNKSYFTLNSGPCAERFHHECTPPAYNGDYLMAHELKKNFPSSYQEQVRPKSKRMSPSRPTSNKRMPKVEELLEKVDAIDVNKLPLKSILNTNPKSPPPGILKKPKVKLEGKSADGRRRQRAASESDNHLRDAPVKGFCDGRLTYLSTNTKRAKDNSGTGYTYGSNANALPPTQRPYSSTTYRNKCNTCKESPRHDFESHVLRTTAINDTNNEVVFLEKKQVVVVNNNNKSRAHSPPPHSARPIVSPALPVDSATALTTPKKITPKSPKKKLKKKGLKKCKADAEGEADGNSRSPSPDLESTWEMETDAALAEIMKLEKRTKGDTDIMNVSRKLNGSVVLTRKPPSVNEVLIVHHKETPIKDPQYPRVADGSDPFTKLPTMKDSPLIIPESLVNCLRPSLFPRVPPYLKFVSHDEPAPLKIPLGVQKHLKWKMTSITPIVVKKTLVNSGFRLVKSECDTAECPQEETVDWIGIWGKHMKSIMFRAIKDGQKMNHFPGTFQIGRKDRLWRNLQKLVMKHGLQEFGIMPKTYVLPHDLKILKHDWEKYAANNEKWIIKPPASARGTGIKVVSRWTQIPKKRPVVVQRYVSKPYLINGSKFDMRLYVLITSVHPLRIYLYKDGLARFASVKYNDDAASLNDRYMHLTNYSINRLSKSYTPNEDFSACEGHKWTLLSLFHYLKTEKKVDTDALWNSMKDLVIKTIISGEASISSLTKANITSRYNCYELFGVDVLLDEDLKPWLLEVNISPSLHSASPLDIHVKGPLVTTVLNLAQFHVPVKAHLESLTKEKPHKLGGLPYDCRLFTVYLSKEERDKHIIYTNMEEREMYLRDILSTLTPDDVRHLIQAEDELSQTGDMERIFPTSKTHEYLGFLTGPRYYNRLFDAWESRYTYNREAGRILLRNLCDIGYHLEVPPVPLKGKVTRAIRRAYLGCKSVAHTSDGAERLGSFQNDVDAPSPPPSIVSATSATASADDVTI